MNRKKHTLLIIDGQVQTQKMLKLVLDKAVFKIVSCDTGREALRLGPALKPSLALLDLNLPDMEGVELLAALRGWMQAPIIILSERSADEDVITALNMGAVDYVTKPFNINVLQAHIRANLRQSIALESGESELRNGPMRIDLMRHEVWVDDALISLTPKEFDLLKFLTVHKGKMLLHKQILKEVWGLSHGEDKQYLRVFIGQLRKKIEKSPNSPPMISTKIGIGYRMEVIGTTEQESRQGELWV